MANEKRLISLDEALKATHSEIYWTESQQAAVRSFLVQQPRVDAVVLPCGYGKTVYVVGSKKIVECEIDEISFSVIGLMYLVSFDCDSDCDGCPFNSWKQDYSGDWSCDGEYNQASVKGCDFGKTVFLTREEAEAALAKMDGGEDDVSITD